MLREGLIWRAWLGFRASTVPGGALREPLDFVGAFLFLLRSASILRRIAWESQPIALIKHLSSSGMTYLITLRLVLSLSATGGAHGATSNVAGRGMSGS